MTSATKQDWLPAIERIVREHTAAWVDIASGAWIGDSGQLGAEGSAQWAVLVHPSSAETLLQALAALNRESRAHLRARLLPTAMRVADELALVREARNN